jgi:hypothetical protein
MATLKVGMTNPQQFWPLGRIIHLKKKLGGDKYNLRRNEKRGIFYYLVILFLLKNIHKRKLNKVQVGIYYSGI